MVENERANDTEADIYPRLRNMYVPLEWASTESSSHNTRIVNILEAYNYWVLNENVYIYHW